MKSSKIFLTSVLLLLTLVVTAQAAWTPAPSNPPDNNAPEPINVTATSQKKDGGLTLGGKLVVKNIEAPDCIPGSGLLGGFKCLFGNVVNIGTGDLTSGNDSLVVDNFLVARSILATKMLGAGESFQYATSTAGENKILISTDSSGSADWADFQTIYNECVQSGACTTSGGDSNWEVNDVGQLVNKNPNGNVGIKANLGIAGRFSVSETSILGKGAEIIGANSLEFGTVLPGTKATDAGKIRYNNTAPRSLDIYGGGLAGSKRLVNVYDDLNVGGDITYDGDLYNCVGTGASRVCTKMTGDNYWLKKPEYNSISIDQTDAPLVNGKNNWNLAIGSNSAFGSKLSVSATGVVGDLARLFRLQGASGQNWYIINDTDKSLMLKTDSPNAQGFSFADESGNKVLDIRTDAGNLLTGKVSVNGNLEVSNSAIAKEFCIQGQNGALNCSTFSEKYHSADTNKDWKISSGEYNTYLAFYNAGAYHCDSNTSSGYAPGSGSTNCTPSDADYEPQDWKISLSENLRLIQMRNSTQYRPCVGGEDGFCVFVDDSLNNVSNGISTGQTLAWSGSKWEPNSVLNVSPQTSNVLLNGVFNILGVIGGKTETASIKIVPTTLDNNATPALSLDGGGANREVYIPGILTIGNETNSSNAQSKLILRDGNQGEGKVLVSNSLGFASWKATSTLNISGGDSNWTKVGNDLFNTNSGKVVITAGNPSHTLNLNSSASPLIGESAEFVVNNRASFAYDGPAQAVVISDADADKDIVFKSGRGSGTNSIERLRIDNGTGNVGVGTNAPTSLFTVLKNVAGGRGGEISIVNGANPQVNNEAALNFGLEPSTYNGNAGNSQIKSILTNVNGSADLVFSGWNGVAGSGGSFSEYMRIKSGGSVGIGTNAPKTKLDVNGDTNVDGKLIVSSESGFSGANLEVTGQALIRGNGARLFLASSESTNPDPTQTPVWNLDNYTGGGLDKGFRIYRQANMGTNQAQWPTEAFMIEGVNGNVGIGRVPTQTGTKLDIGGEITVRGGTPGLNKVLTATDSTGKAVWKTLAEIGGGSGLPGGQADQTLRYDNGAWVGTDSLKIADGGVVTAGADLQVMGASLVVGNQAVFGNLGLGILGQATTKLDVNGQIRIRGGSPGLNKILVSDANGLATWQNASVIIPSVTDNDKQTLSFSNNTLAISGGNSIPLYSAGTGLVISGNTLSTQNTQALWNANQLQGRSVVATVPSNGQVLKWNGSAWAPSNETLSGLPVANSTNANQILKSNGTSWVAGGSNLIMESGTGKVGINLPGLATLQSTNEKLRVMGGVLTDRLRVQGSSGSSGGDPAPAVGRVLTAKDSTGQAIWDDVKIASIYCEWTKNSSGNFVASGGCTGSIASSDANDNYILTCPATYKVVSGGAWCDSSFGSMNALRESRPNSANSWKISCRRTSSLFGSTSSQPNGASLVCAK
ncbi:MAG: hypothetical protein K8Q91_03350 [Candidatus Vogelbacteria bacterium]|nr:hypothetical protein [Candidatus Vogelbacteria bacterium]